MLRRLAPILLLALMLAPGTWLRTPVGATFDSPVFVLAIIEPGAKPPPGWTLEGVWQYDSTGLMFGGYSALLALDDGRFRAFSDRGGRFTFVAPDRPDGAKATLAPQPVEPRYAAKLWDIESAVRDPASGQVWLGFENTHAIHRFGSDAKPGPVRILDDEVNWPVNGGAEAMVRLSDGRFVIIPEGGGGDAGGLVYPSDPVTGVKPEPIAYDPPVEGFGVTDARQLPDGRIVFLLRNVVWGIPPFEARLAIAPMPDPGEPQVLRPQIALDLTRIVPPENYEGLALRERADGMIDIWIIADDNLSAMQRTLLVKLRFDRAKAARIEAQQTKQKARE